MDTGTRNSDGDSIYKYQNIGNGWTHGVILSQRVDLRGIDIPVLNGFTLFATQTFARSEVTLSDGTRRAFKDQAPFFADLAVEWTDPTERLSLSAGLGYTAAIKTSGDSASDRRRPEVTLDLAAHYDLTPGVELYALAKNVTGTERVSRKIDGSVETQSGVKSYFAGFRSKF